MVAKPAETARLLDYDDALRIVLGEARRLGTESVPLSALLGRTLAEPVLARCDLPPFDSSAVDGYAVGAGDVGTAGPFRLLGESKAGGGFAGKVEAGSVVRVFTGAPLPAGTVTVVMQEDADVFDDGVRFAETTKPGKHIRRRGEELRAGEVVVPAGPVTPATLGAIASAGVAAASVWRLPRVGILATGDELATPGADLGPGQIFESNSLALGAAVQAQGLEDLRIEQSDDGPAAVREALATLLESCDVVVTSGGVSVGDYDVVRPVLTDLGVEQRFWGVAIKPGKPLYFGIARSGCAVFGLPGNPVSAMVTYVLFVQPYLAAVSGTTPAQRRLKLPILRGLTKDPGRTEFVPCRIVEDGADPMEGRASHKPSLLAAADGLVVFPKDASELGKGAMVEVVPLDWGKP